MSPSPPLPPLRLLSRLISPLPPHLSRTRRRPLSPLVQIRSLSVTPTCSPPCPVVSTSLHLFTLPTSLTPQPLLSPSTSAPHTVPPSTCTPPPTLPSITVTPRFTIRVISELDLPLHLQADHARPHLLHHSPPLPLTLPSPVQQHSPSSMRARRRTCSALWRLTLFVPPVLTCPSLSHPVRKTRAATSRSLHSSPPSTYNAIAPPASPRHPQTHSYSSSSRHSSLLPAVAAALLHAPKWPTLPLWRLTHCLGPS